MKIVCAQCKTVIPGADIDLGRNAGTCRACGIDTPLVENERIAPMWTPLAEERDGDAVVFVAEVTRPPRELKLLGYLVGILFGLANFMTCNALSAGEVPPFLGAHGIIGLFVFYYTLGAAHNRVYFSIGRDRFRVRLRPFPRITWIDVPTADVEGLAIASTTADIIKQKGGPELNAFAIDVKLKSGATRRAPGTFWTRQQTAEIVERLEAALRR